MYGGRAELICTTLQEGPELKQKASRLLGCQSMARYTGWKGDKAAVQEQYEFNKRIGEETGYWKSGVLVCDDGGKVQEKLNAANAVGCNTLTTNNNTTNVK